MPVTTTPDDYTAPDGRRYIKVSADDPDNAFTNTTPLDALLAECEARAHKAIAPNGALLKNGVMMVPYLDALDMQGESRRLVAALRKAMKQRDEWAGEAGQGPPYTPHAEDDAAIAAILRGDAP